MDVSGRLEELQQRAGQAPAAAPVAGSAAGERLGQRIDQAKGDLGLAASPARVQANQLAQQGRRP
jgi:hypothetical protein